MQHSIELHNVSYNYFGKTKVFHKHNLFLANDPQSKRNLYGIIGPSGTGKTTLISILGGQLNPDEGRVLIDGQDIYKTDDKGRRELIAIQMQTSSSLRGELRYNLHFGLPHQFCKKNYNDKYLQKLLINVGLWYLFKDKEGLETLIGEGGVNLSGGQRQRLNFAGLYLRAKFYQPSLLLIDEPTSSLDEISEQAITKMILELAKDSMTLVVAHRLKTLDEAVAILDSSLFKKDKNLEFYTKAQLKKHSKYYQELLSGKAVLEA